MTRRFLLARALPGVALLAGTLALACPMLSAAAGTFRDDDPMAREPETQDASGASAWTIDPFIDLAVNLFRAPGDPQVGGRAGNVNSIDEVPDSSWFTNRIVARRVLIPEAVRGSHEGSDPAPGTWTITAAKDAGAAPGLVIIDAAGVTWHLTFDARDQPDTATGALIVATRIFWTLGYWQADQVLTSVDPQRVVIGDTAQVDTPAGRKARMRPGHLEAIWQRAHRSADGTFRAVAARQLPGRPLGGFRFHGTRPDDPNDVIPHEHRRELRALKVFGAWTNFVDMKAGNTLDMLATGENGGRVRHYLLDVGSTFGAGAGADAARGFDEGWEHLFEGGLAWKRLLALGFPLRPWHTVAYANVPAVGRFEGAAFDPLTWKPRVPAAALRHARPDDLFWAARRVIAFSDEMIHALAATAKYSDPAATRHLAGVLIARRDRIAAAYLNAVSPLVDFNLSEDGRLRFDNAALDAGAAAAPRGYTVSWARFDNAAGTVLPIGDTVASAQGADPPAPLPRELNAFVRVTVQAIEPPVDTWTPVHAYFRRQGDGWTLVGLERDGL